VLILPYLTPVAGEFLADGFAAEAFDRIFGRGISEIEIVGVLAVKVRHLQTRLLVLKAPQRVPVEEE
jgi:hypothetical protein